jgi:hypothetical protein
MGFREIKRAINVHIPIKKRKKDSGKTLEFCIKETESAMKWFLECF